jgi:hypothetical protein
MQEKQLVADMATEVLARQAEARAEWTGTTFEMSLTAVLETEAGQQLGELRDGSHAEEEAAKWQEGLAPKRVKERHRTRQEERSRALEDAAWTLFVQEEMREMELRKDGQLAGALNKMRGASPIALPAALPAALWHLASQDRRQAEEGLVALMSGGKVSYKHFDDLTQKDRPARIAASRLRTTWLKENQDGWGSRHG